MNSKEIFAHATTKEYIKAAREISKYYKIGCCEPPELTRRYESAVKNYCDFLNSKKLYMPRQKHKFDCKDKSTWKYKDIIVAFDSSGDKIYGGHVLNSEWRKNNGR